jgi:predicted metal-dependent phosphoesterase TrpH
MRYKKMDMHVHSCYSEEPIPNLSGITFSPRETPEELYIRAKQRGMDFVTITDHDTIAGCLDFLSRHPGMRDFIVGEEVSTQLPLSKLTVHVNVYGHDARQHAELQRRRGNAFEVASYCREQGLFFVWNHPFYRENLSIIEGKEFMRFLGEVPVIEIRNGGRMQVLNVLAEEVAVACGKAMQGGSDTHTGNIGEVYTAVPCATVEGFLAGILQGDSRIVGRHSTKKDFFRHNYLAGMRHTVSSNFRARSSAVKGAQVLSLGFLALLLSPWVVRRHFAGQKEMARIALAALPSLGQLSPTLLDAV